MQSPCLRHDGKFESLKRPQIHHAKHRHAKRLSTKKRGDAQHAVNHLKVDEIKEIPNCREEYTCDAHRTRSLGDYARKHIAVRASDNVVAVCCYLEDSDSSG